MVREYKHEVHVSEFSSRNVMSSVLVPSCWVDTAGGPFCHVVVLGWPLRCFFVRFRPRQIDVLAACFVARSFLPFGSLLFVCQRML